MVDTPKTDAIRNTPIMGETVTPHKWDKMTEHARELERALAAMTKQRNDWHQDALLFAAEQMKRAEKAERDLRIANLKANTSLANNLCPDHRDKQHGKPCLACAIEKAEAELARVREDAERYRWLADKVIAPDYGDNDSVPHQKGYWIKHCKGPRVIYGDSLNAAIDAARKESGE